MPTVGDNLERPTYKILRTIHGGTVGICRLAEHGVFGDLVVRKTISLLGVPDSMAREPHLLKEANHDYLIKVREAEWERSAEFKGLEAVTFTCDYYPGGSVYEALAQGHEFALADVLRICGQILDALEYLHEDRGYLHRDVKPGNILLDEPRQNAVLTDLGSAGKIDPATGRAPDYGSTPLYLAPEARPTGHVTRRSDLYSMGMVTIEMITGAFPYQHIRDEDVDSRLAAGKRALPDRYFAFPPHVPRNVQRFIRSLVNADPSRRPTSARAALQELNNLTYVDWRRTAGAGLLGEWIGTWPPNKIPSQRRSYRVQARAVERGRRAGQVHLTATWHKPERPWRRLGTLDSYATASDGRALNELFRQVETIAKSTTT